MKDPLSIDEQFISNIFKKYQKAKIILQYEANSLQEKTIVYGQDTIDSKQLAEYQHYLQVVDTILALLPKTEYNCLVKEFLAVESKWWQKQYSQATYQKLKTKAITRFLYLFLL